MEHFKGINENERYQNDVLNEMRKQTKLLEQIAQLLQREDKPESHKRPYTRREK